MSHHRKKTQAIRAFPWHFSVLFDAFSKKPAQHMYHKCHKRPLGGVVGHQPSHSTPPTQNTRNNLY
jgi:hypothetical protein